MTLHPHPHRSKQSQTSDLPTAKVRVPCIIIRCPQTHQSLPDQLTFMEPKWDRECAYLQRSNKRRKKKVHTNNSRPTSQQPCLSQPSPCQTPSHTQSIFTRALKFFGCAASLPTWKGLDYSALCEWNRVHGGVAGSSAHALPPRPLEVLGES
ncbi:hypothetical protein P280DRAFT_465324 [Massarina eburnea CBS 473.64]|uniref:Uncharacterized protein n=1 Tax=Massarina eburnea CBS 473.64 TaxID=1395130 RepID=A0A6A6SFP4_9PLEO|nr:hypothetical protein P280DRAFT_465324 [Massarina eburnea CBS 473.64]